MTLDRRQALLGMGSALLGVGTGGRLARANAVVLGRILANVDGISEEWFMTMIDGESQSRWTGVETFQKVRIIGHRSPETARSLAGAIVISFDVVGVADAQGIPVAREEIRILDRGFSSGYMARADQGARVQLDERRIDGTTMALSGTFRARLGYSNSFGAQVSFQNTRFLEGRFEGQVERAEG